MTDYVKNIILEREMQLLAFNKILEHLDNIKINNIERKQYQKDEDDSEEKRIKNEKECIQKDRGVYIPGCPVGCDFDVGDDYSFGKFEKMYDI